MDEDPEKFFRFFEEARQRGFEILTAQSQTEATSAHPSDTTAPSTLDD
jgi:hypothetical protein